MCSCTTLDSAKTLTKEAEVITQLRLMPVLQMMPGVLDLTKHTSQGPLFRALGTREHYVLTVSLKAFCIF